MHTFVLDAIVQSSLTRSYMPFTLSMMEIVILGLYMATMMGVAA